MARIQLYMELIAMGMPDELFGEINIRSEYPQVIKGVVDSLVADLQNDAEVKSYQVINMNSNNTKVIVRSTGTFKEAQGILDEILGMSAEDIPETGDLNFETTQISKTDNVLAISVKLDADEKYLAHILHAM